MKIIANEIMDEERALYHTTDAEVKNCVFRGARDGESPLKECRRIAVFNCVFSLRYPLWHAEDFTVEHSVMDGAARAPVWYSKRGVFSDGTFDCVKFLRECEQIRLLRCRVNSAESAWSCRNMEIEDCEIESVYFLLGSRDVDIRRLKMKGNYSFQYVENMTVSDSELDTKDMFWHAKNVTVENSVVRGEYLGWYSEGLTLRNCDIYGTQPFCYCKRLRLEHCRMHGCDRAFEYSDVVADVDRVESIQNPRSGRIAVRSVGEIIREGAVMDCNAEIVVEKS